MLDTSIKQVRFKTTGEIRQTIGYDPTFEGVGAYCVKHTPMEVVSDGVQPLEWYSSNVVEPVPGEPDTSPLTDGYRVKRHVRITQDNEVMISLNTSSVYASDGLPEWFKPLQPIVEDWVFTGMTIDLDNVHYHISIEEVKPPRQ